MPKQIRILIAEDHDVVREGLKILIHADRDLQIVGEASSGPAAVKLARELRPNVVLMDIAMPNGNGLEAARQISSQMPEARILILSAYHDEEMVQKVLEAGAAGYLTKHSAAEELLTALREVGSGNNYYSPAIAQKLRDRRRISFQNGHPQANSARLTQREKQVLRLIATGQPNKQIADSLGLSIKTVEKHRQAAMDKLNIHDTASLTRYALSKGLA